MFRSAVSGFDDFLLGLWVLANFGPGLRLLVTPKAPLGTSLSVLHATTLVNDDTNAKKGGDKRSRRLLRCLQAQEIVSESNNILAQELDSFDVSHETTKFVSNR